MRTLEDFRSDLLATLRELGDSPSLHDVEQAGRRLVADGIPDGASLEGLLLLRDLALQKQLQETQNDNSEGKAE